MKENDNEEIKKEENKEINIINQEKIIFSEYPPEILASKKKDKYNLMEINKEFDEILYFNNYFSVLFLFRR